jgi:hypothetical protein
MNDRRCRYCQQLFQSSRYHPHQLVCSRPDCQRQRRRDYHCRKLRTDAVYHQVCRDSQQKWRSRNPDYPASTGSPTPNPSSEIGKVSAGETASATCRIL